jgi:hypothetical protein
VDFAIESHFPCVGSGQVPMQEREKDPKDLQLKRKVALEKNKKDIRLLFDI